MEQVVGSCMAGGARLAGAASPQAYMLDESWLLDSGMLFAPLTVKLASSRRVWMMLGKLFKPSVPKVSLLVKTVID